MNVHSIARSEKFLRKLAGMADLENALKKLDRLTQEEARMAHTEVLRITHSIREEVKIVDGKVERVEDKVENVSDKVEGVGDKVQCVDEKVQVVIDGARGLSSQLTTVQTFILSDGKQARVAAKEAKLIIQQIANGIDEIECSCLPTPSLDTCA
jgi:23S rRNA pseudoU1915 N3-methylase RlmH